MYIYILYVMWQQHILKQWVYAYMQWVYNTQLESSGPEKNNHTCISHITGLSVSCESFCQLVKQSSGWQTSPKATNPQHTYS